MGTEYLSVTVTIVFTIATSLLVGRYLFHVFTGRRTLLDPVLVPLERLVIRLTGVDPNEQQDWKRYSVSLLVSNVFMWLATWTIYGGAAHPAVYAVDRARDEGELALARAALKVGLPVLGICRGAQVINVALGGTLVEHVPEANGGADTAVVFVLGAASCGSAGPQPLAKSESRIRRPTTFTPVRSNRMLMGGSR